MKKFHFRLERILELKKYKENQWEIKLGKITGLCEQVKREIRDLGAKRREAFLNRTNGDSLHLSVTETYITRLDSRAQKLKADLRKLEEERFSIQEKFLEASKERKIYDKLKEKQAVQFHKEELRREYMEIDDLNSGVAARNRGGANGGS